MKIAVTGGSGFIGKWLLRSEKDEIDFFVLGTRKDLRKIEANGRDYEYIPTDYSLSRLTEILKKADAVIHLASVRTAFDKFEPYTDNFMISSRLFEACRQLNIKNVVALSSRAVYSKSELVPWSEDQAACPVSYYGISKVTMENLAHYYNNNHGMNIKCLRVAQVLGYGEREGYMLMTFIRQAFDRKELKVHGKGSGRREYIYVRDVVNAIYKALRSYQVSGIFNIGTGTNLSHLELAELINRVFDNEGNLILLPELKEDTSVSLMNIGKAKSILGWEPEWSIENGLKEIRQIMLSGKFD